MFWQELKMFTLSAFDFRSKNQYRICRFKNVFTVQYRSRQHGLWEVYYSHLFNTWMFDTQEDAEIALRECMDYFKAKQAHDNRKN
jgi:hypothetical protein